MMMAIVIHIKRRSFLLFQTEANSQLATLLIIKTAVALKIPSKVCDQVPTDNTSPSI